MLVSFFGGSFSSNPLGCWVVDFSVLAAAWRHVWGEGVAVFFLCLTDVCCFGCEIAWAAQRQPVSSFHPLKSAKRNSTAKTLEIRVASSCPLGTHCLSAWFGFGQCLCVASSEQAFAWGRCKCLVALKNDSVFRVSKKMSEVGCWF